LFLPANVDISHNLRVSFHVTEHLVYVMERRAGLVNHQSVTAADKLIQTLLGFEKSEKWQLGELAAYLGQPKSTVHRNLTTLKRYGLVEQEEETNRYRLGLKAWQLAQTSRPYTTLCQKARHHLEGLADSSAETTFLTVVEGVYSLCVDRVEHAQGLRLSMEIGSRSPLHLGASNLVLLAHLESPEQDAALRYWISDEAERRGLLAQLRAIREQGYVFTIAQLTPDVAALAVPILNQSGGLVAGLSIGGYAKRFTRAAGERLLPAVKQASLRISQSLVDVVKPQEVVRGA
jgi:IclR family KDG regulon transcriptional repressor